MSHAARTEGSAGALSTSHAPHPRGSRHVCTEAGDLPPAATTTTTIPSPTLGSTLSPPPLLASLSSSSAVAPHFYVRPLRSRQAGVSHSSTNHYRYSSGTWTAVSESTPSSTSSPSSPPKEVLSSHVKVNHRSTPHEIEGCTGRNSPGTPLVSPSLPLQPPALLTRLGCGVGSSVLLGSHLTTTPPSTHGAPAATATVPTVAPVYLWHRTNLAAGAAPRLRLHRPSGGASAPTIPTCISATCAGGRRDTVASSVPATNTTLVATQTTAAAAAAVGKGVGTGAPPKSGGDVVGILAPPTLEGAFVGSARGSTDVDAAQQSLSRTLAGGNLGGGATTMTTSLSKLQQQQQLLTTLLSSGGASRAPCAKPNFCLVPPFRFARVESGVYRGAYPVLRNFSFIRRLRLRTIVSLIPEPPTYDLKCFAEAEHIQVHHIRAERAKGEVQLLPSEVSEALQLIINKDMHPLYIHCLDGRHITGLIIMALRKLLQWDAKVAHAEFQRFTREMQDEVAFMADYTGPLLVPPHLPAWLWGGSLYDAATGRQKRLPATIRLRLTTAVSGGTGGAATVGGSVAAAPGGGLGIGSPGATSAAVCHNPKGSARGASGDLRRHAAAPWMRVPQAESVAADGQHYIDVDRLPVVQMLSEALPSTLSSALVSQTQRPTALGTGPASANGGRTGTQPPVELNLTRCSAHSSHPTSANSSIAGIPAAAASGTVGIGGGNRWRGTPTGEAARQHHRQPVSSFMNSDAALTKGAGASVLLDGRVGTHIWTSGLPVSPAAAVGGSGGSSAAGGSGAVVGVSGLVTVSPPPAVRTAKRSFSR
ncbi:hypothetical protein JKF63_07276 [Porcisia hertigi]|uniref:Tyrosine phospatase-like protein n=1 Tax=Porcisia hertigi TaxID=2761500 RepID=A0A837A9Q8_9TRYP|nr:hypothetical protein JKF63_07276 [Porcisia hertigi]